MPQYCLPVITTPPSAQHQTVEEDERKDRQETCHYGMAMPLSDPGKYQANYPNLFIAG